VLISTSTILPLFPEDELLSTLLVKPATRMWWNYSFYRVLM